MYDKREYTLSGFPERLIMILNFNGWSGAELARRIRITSASVYHWLDGYTVPNIIYINRICKVANVSADWLVLGKGKMNGLL